MSIGLVVGRVFGPSGRPAPNATIALTYVRSAEGNDFGPMGPNGERRFIYGNIRSNGQYTIPFVWNPTEIGGAMLTCEMFITAYMPTGGGPDAKVLARAQGFLFQNLMHMSQMFTSSFGSTPEVLDFGVDLAISTIKGFTPTPFWKTTALWTIEQYMVIGGTNLYLR